MTPSLPILFLLAAQPGLHSGLWDATLEVDGRQIAFQLELEPAAGQVRGALLDGDRRIWSTSGSWAGNLLTLHWDYFDSRLEATLDKGILRGAYRRRTRAGLVSRPFTARPFQPPPAVEGAPPVSFAGLWRIQTDAPRGVRVMDGRFAQSGVYVTGTIQRLDGDFGVLAGRIDGRRLTLSHFDGVRATLLEAELRPDGTLGGTLDGRTKFTAARMEDAARLGLPLPPDPSRSVSVKNPLEPLAFACVDLDGRRVTSIDARFHGKAMIVSIMGSWCPNCHDEAELLVELDRRYRAQGLEIVALGFEYTGESERDRNQLRAFARRHGAAYTFLYAGTTEEGSVLRVLPQLASFAAFPTTIFLDRSHKVRAVHTGFAGPANPHEHARVKEEFDALARQILGAR